MTKNSWSRVLEAMKAAQEQAAWPDLNNADEQSRSRDDYITGDASKIMDPQIAAIYVAAHEKRLRDLLSVIEPGGRGSQVNTNLYQNQYPAIENPSMGTTYLPGAKK